MSTTVPAITPDTALRPPENGQRNTPPVSADFFQLGGTLRPDAPSYVRRRADDSLLAALQRHDIALVLAPRQTGKSSLMTRVWDILRSEGTNAAIIDLQSIGGETDRSRFFRSLALRVARGLPLKTNLSEWWAQNNTLSPPDQFQLFLEDVVLPETTGDVVLFFDEIDSTLKLPFSDEFFTTLRALYNARAHEPQLRRLTYALIGTASPAQFMLDKDRTPFNIGVEIPLEDFDEKDMDPFRAVLGIRFDHLVKRIFYWSGGQPLLVQRFAKFLYDLPVDQRTAGRLDTHVQETYLKGRVDSDTHLKFIHDYLLAKGENGEVAPVQNALSLYGRVLARKQVASQKDDPAEIRLRLAGVVTVRNGLLVPRNPLYEQIFSEKWIEANLPPDPFADTPLRRWLNNERSPDYLLRGSALREAENSQSPEYKTAEGHDFLLASSQAERRIAEEAQNAERKAKEQALRDKAEAEKATIAADAVTQSLDALLKLKDASSPQEKQEAIRLAVEVVKKVRLPGNTFIDALTGRERRIVDALRLTMFAPLPKLTVKQTNRINDVRFLPNNSVSVLASAENTASVYNAKGRHIARFVHSEHFNYNRKSVFTRLENTVFSPDGKHIITVISEIISVWDVATQKVVARFIHDEPVASAVFSPDGKQVLTACGDRAARIWDVATQEVSGRFVHGRSVTSASFSPDGKQVLTTSDDSTVRVWDVATQEEVARFVHDKSIISATFSPDGKQVLTASRDKRVRIWDVATQEMVSRFVHDKPVTSASFSPDGKQVLTVSGEISYSNTYVWDVATRKEIARFVHESLVTSAMFSPDGRHVVTLGAWHYNSDSIVHVWDVKTRQEVVRFIHEGGVTSATFSPDRNQVLTVSRHRFGFGSNTAYVWSLDIPQAETVGHLLKRAEGQLTLKVAPPAPPNATTAVR